MVHIGTISSILNPVGAGPIFLCYCPSSNCILSRFYFSLKKQLTNTPSKVVIWFELEAFVILTWSNFSNICTIILFYLTINLCHIFLGLYTSTIHLGTCAGSYLLPSCFFLWVARVLCIRDNQLDYWTKSINSLVLLLSPTF